MKSKKADFFWASYADLMTSMFFIMLVLFVLTIVYLKRKERELVNSRQELEEKHEELTREQATYRLKASQYDKIKEIESSINQIDTQFFTYDPVYRKHVLNLDIRFEKKQIFHLGCFCRKATATQERGNSDPEFCECCL